MFITLLVTLDLEDHDVCKVTSGSTSMTNTKGIRILASYDRDNMTTCIIRVG